MSGYEGNEPMYLTEVEQIDGTNCIARQLSAVYATSARDAAWASASTKTTPSLVDLMSDWESEDLCKATEPLWVDAADEGCWIQNLNVARQLFSSEQAIPWS